MISPSPGKGRTMMRIMIMTIIEIMKTKAGEEKVGAGVGVEAGAEAEAEAGIEIEIEIEAGTGTEEVEATDVISATLSTAPSLPEKERGGEVRTDMKEETEGHGEKVEDFLVMVVVVDTTVPTVEVTSSEGKEQDQLVKNYLVMSWNVLSY